MLLIDKFNKIIDKNREKSFKYYLRFENLLYRKTNFSKLKNKDKKLLDIMQNDNQQSPYPYRPTVMWDGLSRQLENSLHKEGIQSAEYQSFNTVFSQSVPGNPKYYRFALWMFYKEIKKKDTDNLLKRLKLPSFDNRFVFNFEGIDISWDMLISIDTLYSIKEGFKEIFSKKFTLLDLGGGWGRLGYFLKQINKKVTYINSDLPEPLLISQNRLQILLAKEKILKYDKIKQQKYISEGFLGEFGLVFCGPQHLRKFADKSIDIAVNIASFQEMTREQVEQYFNLLNRLVDSYVYLQEYWHHHYLKKKYRTIGDLKEYSFPIKWKKIFLRNTEFSERYFEALFKINK